MLEIIIQLKVRLFRTSTAPEMFQVCIFKVGNSILCRNKTIHCCRITRSFVSITHWWVAQTTQISDSLKPKTSLKDSILLWLQEEKQRSSNSSALAVIFTPPAKRAWHLSALSCANAQNDNPWHHYEQLMWKLREWWLQYRVYYLPAMHLDSKYKVNLIFYTDELIFSLAIFSLVWVMCF